MSNSRPVAVLDSCVLYPVATTDGLMSLASSGLFSAKWTRLIEDEWIRAIERQRQDLVGRLTLRRDAMRDAIVDWEIPEAAWSRISIDDQLPDPNDEHVITAAIAAGADVIVTANGNDFPSRIADPLGLEIMHPDPFILELCESDKDLWVATFASMRSRLRRPEMTPEDFVHRIERAGLPKTAQKLRGDLRLL